MFASVLISYEVKSLDKTFTYKIPSNLDIKIGMKVRVPFGNKLINGFVIDIVNSSAYGTKMPRASWDFVGNLKLPFPNLEEQQKISKYLDEKLIHFDNTIEKTKQTIKKLKEAKEALISQAVTGKIEVL